ncbi:hypothetical protein Vafri_11749, partial [Volvox africanus]
MEFHRHWDSGSMCEWIESEFQPAAAETTWEFGPKAHITDGKNPPSAILAAGFSVPPGESGGCTDAPGASIISAAVVESTARPHTDVPPADTQLELSAMQPDHHHDYQQQQQQQQQPRPESPADGTPVTVSGTSPASSVPGLPAPQTLPPPPPPRSPHTAPHSHTYHYHHHHHRHDQQTLNDGYLLKRHAEDDTEESSDADDSVS